MVAKKKAVKKKAKPRAPRAPRATSAAALATAALKRAQTRSVMEDVKSRYAAKYGRAPSEAMARSIMAAIAAGIPIDATFRDPDPLVVAPPTQTQVPLVAINSGPMGQPRAPRVPAALVQRVGPPAPVQRVGPPAPPRMPPRPPTQAQQAAAVTANIRAARTRNARAQAAALAAAVPQGALGPLQQAVRAQAQADRDDVYLAFPPEPQEQAPPLPPPLPARPLTQADRDAAFLENRRATRARRGRPPSPPPLPKRPLTQADRDAAYLQAAIERRLPPAPRERAPPLPPPPLPAPPLTQADRDAAYLESRRATRARRDEVMTAERADEANRRLAAIQQQINTQGALELGQDDPILQRGRQQVAAAEAAAQTAEERSRAIANRRFEAALQGQTRPTVLIQDPVSAETSASTARLQQRDRDLTVLREERDAAVRAMQEQARAQEQAREQPPTRKRKAEDDVVKMMKSLKIAPDFPPITLEQLDQSQNWFAGPLGENPVIPNAPPGMRVKMRMSRSGPRPVIRNGQVQFEPEPILLPNAPFPPAPPPMPPPPRTQADRDAAFRESIQAARNRPSPEELERAAFMARAAQLAADLPASRARAAAREAALYQQRMSARNAPPVEVGDVGMNFAADPSEPVLPAEGEVGTFDDLGEGSKIQSIAFPIGEWSSASALRWLRAHGFVPQKKGEAKANFLRYRIRAPRFSNYITRAVQSKGRKIHLIIGV
jgi:hypothetical protein